MKTLTDFLDRLSGPLLAALGLANALFALSLVAVLFVASQALPARADDTCGGVNVLDEMKRDDPARYARVMAEADATPNGDTLLFRIEKPGVAPSWLFGTMHLTDERVVNLPDGAREAFDGAKTVVIETTEILDPSKAQMALFSKPELTMFTDGKQLTDYLTGEQRDILKEGLAKRGLQLALVDRMKPWLITAMVALPKCEMDRKQSGQSFLDLKLAEDAERDGKELAGLETIVEQLEAMASLPIEFHVNSLVESIELGDRINDFVETTIQLYAEGNTGKVWPMLRAATEEMEAGKDLAVDYAAFEETMVHVRNRNMVERALPLLDKGGAFIAVGALHLPGEKGLAALIEQAGFTVTPVHD
ncbi:MAG: TraB/GumN family protein [Oricola sp.]